jgi:hypothetical protein
VRRRTAVILLVLVLVGAALNFPVAMWCDRSRAGAAAVPQTLNVFGAEAGVKEWPAVTPHAKEWPAPTQWSESRRFGYSRIGVWSANPAPAGGGGQATQFQMDAVFLGWPLPCVRRVQMWWPWTDPAWQTTGEPDPKPSIHWAGALGNPLIFAGVLWAVLVAPFEVFGWGRRRSRRRRGACERCGYPRGDGTVCTECGAALPRREDVAAAAGTGVESA